MGEIKEPEIVTLRAMDQSTPEVADALVRELDISHNMMFMGSLTHTRSFSMQDLGWPHYLVTSTSLAHL